MRPDTATRALSRRSTFRLAGHVTLGTLALGTVAACSGNGDDGEQSEPDPLIAQADLARGDAAAASAAAATAPDRAGALGVIATQRNAHADALNAEVARAAGRYADGSTPQSQTSTTSAPPPPPAPPPTIDQLRARLTISQHRAADLARSQSAYRAGLLGSISAACATHVAVLLR